MNKPAVIFLRNGLISAMAALAIWLLPFFLRDDAEKARPPQEPKDVGADKPDLLKELEVAVVPPRPVRAPRELRAQSPSKVPPQPAAETLPQRQPPSQAETPLPVVLPPPGRELAGPVGAEPRVDMQQPAPQETFEDRIRKAMLAEAYATNPAPQPEPVLRQASIASSVPPTPPVPVPAPPAAQQAPVSVQEPSRPEPVIVALLPPVPEPHPLRMPLLDDVPNGEQPPAVQAAVIAEPTPKPRLAATGALTFLTDLWRPSGPALRSPPMDESDDRINTAAVVAVPAPALPASRLPEPPAVASPAPRKAAPVDWVPRSCDTGNDFWK